ncbi:DUF2147 domain-containing protein [Jannaschia sp. Os4]|uniref:DUF2147 domain-containing protein n=1 Tax=Jannaschia sp. Os4 TaxID=2807617 RepID=UPI00193A8D11|nr:DUF2147 domain-containing protein [Jannaschia sp. Os4]MBM2576980.1 DUF2147 domain-containing protein [Jannaschia sp. Os4]
MKRIILAAAAVLGMAGAASADPVLGRWQSEPGETGGYIRVDLAPCGGQVCGTIASVHGNDNTSIVGRRIIWDMNANGGGRYSGGRIWAPDQDKTYRSKMELQGANQLKVSGCVGPICRGQTWTRVR